MLGRCSEGARAWGDMGPWGSWASQSGGLALGEGRALPILIPDPHGTPSPTCTPCKERWGVAAPWGPLPEPRALPCGGFKERHCCSRGVLGSMGIVMARDRTPAGRLLQS